MSLTTISENRYEHGVIIATIRDDAGLKTITVAHDGIGERSQTLNLSLTPGRIYDLELERREPAIPPPLHHYRLTPLFPGLELGWDHPFQSLEPVSSWSFNADESEIARIRLFTDSPAPFNVPQATEVVYTIVRPNGGIIARDVTIAGLPAEITVPQDVSSAKIINLRANGHLRMEKITGSDRGFYAVPCIPQSGHFGANIAGGPPGIGPPPQGQPVIAGQPSQAGSPDSDGGVPVAPIAGGGVAVLLAGFGGWLYFTNKRRSLAIQPATNTAATAGGAPHSPTATVVQARPEQALGSGTQPSSNMIGAVTPASAAPAQPPLPQEVLPARAAVPDAEMTKPPPSGLSMREVEVVTLIARGFTNKQIAQELSISDATAKRHIENILRKLGLSTRTQVAIWATQNGYGNGNSTRP